MKLYDSNLSGSLRVSGAADNESYFLGHNVGVGTNNPRYKLHVVGDSFIDGQLTIRSGVIDSGSVLYTSGSNKFGNDMADEHAFTGSFFATASEYNLMGGNVGIGQRTPAKALHIGDASNNTGNGTIRLQGYSAGGSGNYHEIVSHGDNLAFYRNTTLGLFLQYNGKVGIGTTTANDALDIVGAIRTTGNISGSSTSTGSFGVVHTAGHIGVGTTAPNISEGAAGSNAVTIAGSAANRNALLELKGTRSNANDFSSYIRNFSNSGATPITDIQSLRGASDTSGSLRILTSNKLALSITGSNQNIGIGTDSPATNLHIYKSSGDVGLRLTGIATSDERIADISFFNNTDSVGAIQAYRDGANDQMSMRFLTQGSDGNLERLKITHDGQISGSSTSTGSFGKLELRTQSTTNPVLTLGDLGVVDYNYSFPDAFTLKLEIGSAAERTFQLNNSAAGKFNFSTDGGVTVGTHITSSGHIISSKAHGLISGSSTSTGSFGDVESSRIRFRGDQAVSTEAGVIGLHTNNYMYVYGGTTGLALMAETGIDGIKILDGGSSGAG